MHRPASRRRGSVRAPSQIQIVKRGRISVRYRRCRIRFLFPVLLAATRSSASFLLRGNTSPFPSLLPIRNGVGGRGQPPTIDHHLAHVSSFRFSQWKPHEHSRLRKQRFLSDVHRSWWGMSCVYLRTPWKNTRFVPLVRRLALFGLLGGSYSTHVRYYI